MAFTVKNWIDSPSTSTPLSAAALEDQETRLSDHTERHGAATSVMDPAFEVAADGATDDTTGFEAARDSVGAGDHIYVPSGTYVIDNLALSVANQTWDFAPGAVLKAPDSSGNNAKIITLSATYVTIRGGEFDGNVANNGSASAVAGAVQIGAAHCTVEGAYVHSTKGYGIHGAPTDIDVAMDDVLVKNCRFIGCYADSVFFNLVGVSVASNGLRIESCWADNSSVAVGNISGGGFQFFGDSTLGVQPKGAAIIDCHANSRTDATADVAGISLFNVNGGKISGCWSGNHSMESYAIGTGTDIAMTNCVAYGALDYGIEINPATRCSVTNCVIDGNAATPAGISVSSSSDVTITGNTIGNMGATGFGIKHEGGASTRLKIADNLIRATNRAIGFSSDPSDVSVTGNLCAGDGTDWGFVADTATAGSKRWLVQGNTFLDCATSAILLYRGSSQTLSNVWIRDNTYQNCGAVRTLTNVTLDSSCWAETANTVPAYTPTNVTPDRSYDANSTTTEELADVLGTLIADLQAAGYLG